MIKRALITVGLLLFLRLLVPAFSVYAEMVQVTGSSANIRAEPGTHSKIISSVNRGELLPVIDSTDKWWKVRIKDGTEAWIYKRAVKTVNTAKENTETGNAAKKNDPLQIQVMAKEILGDYLKWAVLNEVYLEEYQTARLDVMVTADWSRLNQEDQKKIMLRVAKEFSRFCEEDPSLKTKNKAAPYVAFFDRFNTLLGKANKSDIVTSEDGK